VAIGLERFGLEDFVAGEYWQGELFLDDGQKLYKALKLKRNTIWNGLGLLAKGLYKAVDEAKADGITGNLSGDGLQMGATMIVGPGETQLVFYHAQTSYADHPDPAIVLQMAKEGLETGKTKKKRKKQKKVRSPTDEEAKDQPEGAD